ncbi:MAG: ABC transporter permease [Clostridiales bacterium]
MKLLYIGFYDLLKLFRNKVVFSILIFLPMMFSLFVSLIFNNAENSQEVIKKQVGIENLDKGSYGKKLIKEIEKNKTISVKIYKKGKLYEDVENIDIELGFIIPEIFSENISDLKTPVINTVKAPMSIDSNAVENIISNSYTKLLMPYNLKAYFKENILSKSENNLSIEFEENVLNDLENNYNKNMKNNLVEVKNKWYEGSTESKNYDGTSQTSIGYIIMFVMFTILFGAGEILEEKKFNTWNRLKITPTSKVTIYLGKVLGIFLRGLTQVVILILFGYFVLGISWGNSILATIVVLITFLLCITGLGILLATLVKTNSQLGAISTIVIIPTTALSGCWWPLFIEPDFMQKLAVIFPQYWAMQGLTNTVVGNLGFKSIVNTVGVLLVMTCIFFLIALGRIKK